MKVKDILKKVDDYGLYIEIKRDGASCGIYKKNDALLVYSNKLKESTIKNINVQCLNSKRLLVLNIK